MVIPVRGKKVQPCEVTKLKKKTTVGRLGFFCLFFPEGRIAPVRCRRVRSSQNHSLPLVSSLVDVCGVCSEMFAPSSLLFSLCQVQAVPATSCHRSPSPKQKAPWRLSSPDDQAGCSWLCSWAPPRSPGVSLLSATKRGCRISPSGSLRSESPPNAAPLHERKVFCDSLETIVDQPQKEWNSKCTLPHG